MFAPVRVSCRVSAVPDGATALPPWLCSLLLLPPGLPLPRAVCLEFRRPGGVLFYLHVGNPALSGPTTGKAPSSLSRVYREAFSAFASSACTGLLLQPIGCTRLPTSQAAVLSMSAFQLAAGCLTAGSPRTPQVHSLGMPVRTSAVLHALRSAGIIRGAASPSLGGDAVPPARGVQVAHEPLTRGLAADESARMRDAMLTPSPPGALLPEADPGTGKGRLNARRRRKIMEQRDAEIGH